MLLLINRDKESVRLSVIRSNEIGQKIRFFCFLFFFFCFCIFLGKRKFAGKFFFYSRGVVHVIFFSRLDSIFVCVCVCVCLLDGLGADYLLWWFFFVGLLIEYEALVIWLVLELMGFRFHIRSVTAFWVCFVFIFY